MALTIFSFSKLEMFVLVLLFTLLLTVTGSIDAETQHKIEDCLKSKHVKEIGTDWASNNCDAAGRLVSFRRRRALELVERIPSGPHETNLTFNGSCEGYFAKFGESLAKLEKLTTNLTAGCRVNKLSAIACVYSYRT